jgi:hypothetical protein
MRKMKCTNAPRCLPPGAVVFEENGSSGLLHQNFNNSLTPALKDNL